MKKMSGRELKALRKLCMLEIPEAAAYLSKTSERAWRHWEAGRSPVPYDVANAMIACSVLRRVRIADLRKVKPLRFPATLDEYWDIDPTGTELDWRIQQSAVAVLIAERARSKTNGR